MRTEADSIAATVTAGAKNIALYTGIYSNGLAIWYDFSVIRHIQFVQS